MAFLLSRPSIIGIKGTLPPPPSTTLRAVPPALRAVPPKMLPPSTGPSTIRYGGFPNVINAIRSNIADVMSASVAPTATPDPNVGQPGSANNAGNINGAAGNIGYAVETIKNWRASNPGMATALKVALPAAGIFLFTKGHPVIGALVAGASVPLWLE